MAAARDALVAARLVALILGVMVALCVLGRTVGPSPTAPQPAPAVAAAPADFSNDIVQAERPAVRHPAAGVHASIGSETEPEAGRPGKPGLPATVASPPTVAVASTALPTLHASTRLLRAPRSHRSQAPPAQA